MARMRRAASEMVVEGIKTNIPLHRQTDGDAAFIAGGTQHPLPRRLAGRTKAAL